MRRAFASSIIFFAVLTMGYISFTEKLKSVALPAGATVITGGRLVAVPGQPPLDDAVLILEDGYIKRIFARGKGEVPPNSRVIDARGGSILPAFMDCNVNLLLGSAGIGASPEEFLPDRVIRDLRANLYWGVTTIQSSGDTLSWMTRLRDNEQDNAIISPRLRTAGPLLTAVAGYPACYLPPKISYEATRELKDNTYLQDVIARLTEQQVNALFVIYDGGTDAKPYPKLPLPLLQELIHKARQAGLPVSARVGQLDDLKKTVIAGATSIEFVSEESLDDEALHLMRTRGCYLISALSARLRDAQSTEDIHALISREDVRRTVNSGVLKGLTGKDGYFYRLKMDRQVSDFSAKAWKASQENLLLASRNQVKIVLGTGAGHPAVFHGLALHDELQLLTAAGLTNLQAIDSATRIAAEFLGINGVTGTLTIGSRADIIITDGNPLEDIGRSRAIQWVIKGGNVIERGKLLQ